LFTLVGIAGEDDLDAPDLNTPTAPTSKVDKPAEDKIGDLNGGRAHSIRQFSGNRRANAVSNPRKPTLEPGPSAALRDQLATELEKINSTEEAANWAHRVLGAKNSLTAADAACIEEAFRAKLATFATADGSEKPRETERPRAQRRSDRGKKQRRCNRQERPSGA